MQNYIALLSNAVMCIDGPALFQNLCMRIFLCAHDHMANRVAQEKNAFCILDSRFCELVMQPYHSSLMRCNTYHVLFAGEVAGG